MTGQVARARHVAADIVPKLIVDFDRYFEAEVHRLEFRDRAAVRAYVLDYVSRGLWSASQKQRRPGD